MPTAPAVIGIGEVLWDLQPHGRQLGGAPGNFAYHVHAQGIPAAPASAVGDDALGHDLLRELRDRHVDTSLVATLKEWPTGTVDVDLDDAGKPKYTIHENVAWDHIPAGDALLDAAKTARAVCYGTLAQRDAESRETIRRVLDATPERCLRVFDVNLRQSFYNRGVVEGGLERATMFKLSDEEVADVARLIGAPDEPERFGDALFDRFADLDLVCITRGGEGSTIRRRGGEASDQPTVKAKVVSTVGAGDSFTAGVVSGLLKGLELRDAHDFGTRLAAFVVSQPGAMPELPADLKL